MNSLTIILPTYNEETNISRLILELIQSKDNLNWDLDILVVDDNSSDKTAEMVSDLAKIHPNIRVIVRNSIRGLVFSLNDGIKAAKGKFVMWMDSDFSHPPQILPQVLSLLENNFDVVLGSRFMPGGGDQRNGKFLVQKFLSRFLSILGKKMTKSNFTDFTSGLIAIRKERLIEIGDLKGEYGEYFINLLCDLREKEYSIIEIPYVDKNRQLGNSKTFDGFLKKGIKYLLAILKKQKLIGVSR